MRPGFSLLLLVGALAAFAPSADAHKPSDSYLTLAVAGARVDGRWDIALRDLDHALTLDTDGDGGVTWGELRARHADIAAYALAALTLASDGAPCPATVTEHLVDRHSDGTYAVLLFEAACPAAPLVLQVGYSLFADLDPQHRGLVRVTASGRAQAVILGPDRPVQSVTLAGARAWERIGDFVREGIWHIWTGYDHVLFLLVLLLPAALERHGGGWHVLRIVTAFTVAHSITLSLASLRVVALPSALVESAIAASIVVGAANNVFPLLHARLWTVAFGFGLLHGFGFASVLADLSLERGALVPALLGFNLGVEAGQIAIVAAFLPVAVALRETWLYRRATVVLGSAAIAALAAVWTAERVLAVHILPF